MGEGSFGELSAVDFRKSVTVSHSQNHDIALPQGGNEAGASLDTMERAAIAASIARHNGNLSLVAKELGISRGSLYRKIEKHGL